MRIGAGRGSAAKTGTGAGTVNRPGQTGIGTEKKGGTETMTEIVTAIETAIEIMTENVKEIVIENETEAQSLQAEQVQTEKMVRRKIPQVTI